MNLLITGAWQEAREYVAHIQQKGHSVIFMQWEKDPLPCPCEWVEGVICNGLFLYHSMESFSNLKYVQLTSVGYDRIPMDCADRRGITVRNARGVYSVPMAEYAVGGVLQIYKQFPYFRENQKRHVWEKHRGLLELAGKTVCIIGCGSVGMECAKRFRAFDCGVIGIATSARQQPFFDSVRPVEELNEILSWSDVVILTVPLTDKTRYLMDEARFARMKPGAILVNIGRGAVVDPQALEAALKQGRLRGAVLDVFEEEPLRHDSTLWDMDNVIVTPHNSFAADRNKKRLAETLLRNLETL